jgi:hypothetical protein
MFAFLKNRFISASTIAVATLGGGGTSAATGIGGIGGDRTATPQLKKNIIINLQLIIIPKNSRNCCPFPILIIQQQRQLAKI